MSGGAFEAAVVDGGKFGGAGHAVAAGCANAGWCCMPALPWCHCGIAGGAGAPWVDTYCWPSQYTP